MHAALRLVLALPSLLLPACGEPDPAPPGGGTAPAAAPRPRGPVTVSPPNPDVFLVVVDTLRADRTSAYGYERPTTPWLAERAAEGALFEDATVQGSWTLPSMVSLMTGLYLTRFRDSVSWETPTIGQRFSSAGYRTVAVVGNVLVNEEQGFARGYDHFDAQQSRSSADDASRTEARALPELLDDAFAPLAEAFATDEQGRRPPVLVWLHPFDPHAEYELHGDLADVLPDPTPAERAQFEWHVEEYARRAGLDDDEREALARDVDWLLMARGRYDREVRFTDDLLRGLFDRLRAAGHLDRAVVAFTSDHGEGLWDHFRHQRPKEGEEPPLREALYQEHGAHLFREAVGVPLVLWGEGVPAGVRVEDPVELVDLAPTLLDLAGLPVDPELHGSSLLPAMRGEGAPPREHVFTRSLHQEAVREVATDLKFVRATAIGEQYYGGEQLLLDLRADPRERRDLTSERPAETERLAAVVDAWIERYPTPTTFGEDVSPEQAAMLEALGYTEEVTGRR